jgi:hypothetical protein
MLRVDGRDLGFPAPGEFAMQSTRPRDLGALVLAIGVLLVLFIVSLMLGSPLR